MAGVMAGVMAQADDALGSGASLRLVLHESVTRDDLDDAMVRNGWRLANIVSGGETEPTQLLYLTADRQNLLQLVDDPRINTLYILAQGPDLLRCEREVRETLRMAEEPP